MTSRDIISGLVTPIVIITSTLSYAAMIFSGPLASKLSALWAYRSQMTLPEFENTHVLLVPERFWKISKAVAPEEAA